MTKEAELALIMTAFSYLKNQIEMVNDPKEKETKSYKQTQHFVNRSFVIISTYRRIHQKALKISDLVLATLPDTTSVSVYVAGLELLAQHATIKGKRFSIGGVDDIIELQETAMKWVDADIYEDSIVFSEHFFKELQNRLYRV